MAVLLAAAGLAYLYKKNEDGSWIQGDAAKDWVNVRDVMNQAPNRNLIHTKYPDPMRWGSQSAHVNNKTYVPKMDIKALTSTNWPGSVGNTPWPINAEAYMVAMRDQIYQSEINFGLGMQILKNDLYTGNRSQMMPMTHIRTPNFSPSKPPDWRQVIPPTQGLFTS